MWAWLVDCPPIGKVRRLIISGVTRRGPVRSFVSRDHGSSSRGSQSHARMMWSREGGRERGREGRREGFTNTANVNLNVPHAIIPCLMDYYGERNRQLLSTCRVVSNKLQNFL